MKTIRIPLEQFDLHTFLNKTIDYLSSEVSYEVHPTYSMVWVDRPGDVPVYGPESGWNVLSGLKEEGKSVFFPFAHADEHGLFSCADGNSYGPMFDDEESDAGPVIGMEDTIGYLVQAEGDFLIMNSAIHAGAGCPGPTSQLYVRPDCGVMNGPMETFIRSFIKG